MKYKGYTIYIAIIRVAGDALVLYLSFLAAFWIRFYLGFFPLYFGVPPIENYTQPFIFSVVIIMLVFKGFGLYSEKHILKFSNELFLLIKSITVGMIIIMALTFFQRGYSYSRMLVVVSWFVNILTISVLRYFIGRFEGVLCRLLQEYKKLIIIGTGRTGLRLLGNIRHNSRWGYNVIGFISTEEGNSPLEIDGMPVFGTLGDLNEIIKKKAPDEIILTASDISHDKILKIITMCEKHIISFKMVPDMFNVVTSRVDVFDLGGISLLGLKEAPLEYVWNRLLKRALDITGSIAGLIITAPLYIIIAPIIKFSSQGSVVYSQARCGEDGKAFTLYKFRTMRMDAEQKTGPVWAEEDDPRCTSIGRWLRRFNLDELPQLVNVLKGEMSMVGPRPERPHFVEEFKNNIPRYMSRHLVKSGMTGWAQVNGLRGNTPLEERIKYDLYYIENWSLWFDLKILFITFFPIKSNNRYLIS